MLFPYSELTFLGIIFSDIAYISISLPIMVIKPFRRFLSPI